MPIEIRELVIKVNIVEPKETKVEMFEDDAIQNLKNDLLKECKKAIKKELASLKQR